MSPTAPSTPSDPVITAAARDASPAPPRPDSRPQRPAPPDRPALPGTPSTDPDYAVAIVVGRAGIAPYVEEWEELASLAAEPNPFYEPWMLLPAVEAFASGDEPEFVLVFGYDDHPRPTRRILCGLFPFARRRGVGGVPIRHRALWTHDYNFLSTPLVRRGREAACLDAFLEALARDRGPAILKLGQVAADGRVHAHTLDAINRRGSLAVTSVRASRAFLRPREGVDAESYLRAAVAGKALKEWRRQGARLAETGPVEYAALAQGEPLTPWLDEFVRIEATGWKGRGGTAFACRDADRRWLETVAAAAHARGRLELLALRVAGTTIAMKLNFLAADGAFTFKIAFDESYARFSPGVLLELENVRRAHGHATVRWMDSCAIPEHPMANRLWTERRAIEDLYVATRGFFAGLAVASIPLGRWARGLFRRKARPDAAKERPS